MLIGYLIGVPSVRDVEHLVEKLSLGGGMDACFSATEDHVRDAENEIGLDVSVVEEVVLEHPDVVECEVDS